MPEGETFRDIRFSLPVGTLLTFSDLTVTSDKQSGIQQLYRIQAVPTDSVPESGALVAKQIRFELPVKNLGQEWHLRGQSALSDVARYELSLTFGQSVDKGAWKPGPFLKEAGFTGTGQLDLARDNSLGSPLIVDFAASLVFMVPVRSEAELRAQLDKMPALRELARSHDRVFADLRVIVLLHFLEDLGPFLIALEDRGLDCSKSLFLYKDYPYAHRDLVKATLESRDCNVAGPVTSWNDHTLVSALECFCEADDLPILVIDDGGYLLPAFCRLAALRGHLNRLIGVVEQTSYGAWQIRQLLAEEQTLGVEERLKTVVISVAESDVKRTYEPRFVAEAAAQNVVKLMSNQSWTDTKVLLVGYGAIGSSLLRYLLSNRAKVSVCDPKPLRLVLARNDQATIVAPTLQETMERLESSGSGIDFVFGTTGRTSIDCSAGVLLAKFQPTLVSMSSKQVEFDLEGFKNKAQAVSEWTVDGRRIGTIYTFGDERFLKVMGNGYPINFFAGESVELRHIDPIMALLHACGAELVRPTVIAIEGRDNREAAANSNEKLLRGTMSLDAADKIANHLKLFEPMLKELGE
ncbi:MAG: hypothetical protein ACREXS_02845 [Gammaproteobacteria bacterium]